MFPLKGVKVAFSAGVVALGVFCAGALSAGAKQGPVVKNGDKTEYSSSAAKSSSRSARNNGGSAAAAQPSGSQPATTSPVVDPIDSSYRIGIEDELQISVWREPELSLGVVVRPDGMITLPLLNDVPVMGLTTTQLGDALTEKLKPFVNEPQVTVIVRNIHSRRAYLVGEVSRQGAYSLNGRLTIMELLAEAGGMGPFAKTDKIYVLRKVNGKPVQIPFNYKKSIVGRGDKDNIVLLPGDIVVVP